MEPAVRLREAHHAVQGEGAVSSISTQYLHNIYTISTQYLQYLHCCILSTGAGRAGDGAEGDAGDPGEDQRARVHRVQSDLQVTSDNDPSLTNDNNVCMIVATPPRLGWHTLLTSTTSPSTTARPRLAYLNTVYTPVKAVKQVALSEMAIVS